MNFTRRKSNGNAIADMPAVLWVLFVLILFPLINLATVGLRYTFMLTTSREAAMSASRASTFYADASASDKSARNSAVAMANSTAGRFNGLVVTNTTTNLLVTDLSTNNVTRYSTPIPASSIDTVNNLYSYEVTVTGTVMPLVRYRGPVFGNISGLTGPMNVAITSQKMCENTQGLSQ
jgi:hypothetical protein